MVIAYKGLATVESMLGHYFEAYNYSQDYMLIKDSVFSRENANRLAHLEKQKNDELMEKKQKIHTLELETALKETIFQKRIRNLSFLFVAIIATVLVVVYRQRNRIKKEKKRSDDLLLNILPPEIAEELKDKGFSDAKHYDSVSVLFTDFVNFTGISEHMPPTELLKEINIFFKAFDEIIGRNGLEKIKTIGDAYLAVCGLPQKNETHALNAVQAGLEIIAFVNKRRAEGGLFEIRVGINTGPVVAGIVGVRKFAYDIWVNTVNLANRMESSGERGKVNISETTYMLVKDKYTCTHRGKINAKGKGLMDMYFVE